MSVKSDFLELLKNNVGQYISGEEAAEKIGCSRGAIWKAVKALETEGYSITGVSNKGYCLNEDTDVINADIINDLLDKKSKDFDIHIHKIIDSTNEECKRLANNGAIEGTVVIANEQTAGKGRSGRSFYSPAETGIYISLILRPSMSAAESSRITTIAATAVAEAIEEVTGIDADIKWINDIYVKDKKVCGILTEASLNMETYQVDYIVLGIGINLYVPENNFPTDIKNIAGYIFPEKKWSSRNQLIAKLLMNFNKYYKKIETADYIKGYKKRLLWKNKKINLISGPNITPATLIDVDNECHLIVKYDDGKKDVISTGEISIRLNTNEA